MTYIIYSDGSDFKHKSGRLGIGALIIKEGTTQILDSFGTEISREYVKLFYGTDQCSNPTMEMLAALEALKRFKKFITSPLDQVIVKADYEGVTKWNKGEWKIKAPYIQKIRDNIKEAIKELGCKVDFQWVKGHQSLSIKDGDAYWNNLVDKLAKGESI
jgi:ribonuclease HI